MRKPAKLEQEFEGLTLSDERLVKRARTILSRVAEAPALSFPELLPGSAELEGAYRFFQNDGVSPEALMKPHVRATIERVRQHKVVRVAHDTTGVSYGGTREGLGTLGGGGCGFWLHAALAVSGDEARAPLGVVGIETKVYPTLDEKARRHERLVIQYEKQKRAGRGKSFPKVPTVWPGVKKWTTLPLELQEQFDQVDNVRIIHVMDQEADNTEVFSKLKAAGLHFVIRGSSSRRDRSSVDEPRWVRDSLAESQIVAKRRVRLTARPKATNGHPKRNERDALLSVRATRVTLTSVEDEEIALNIVEVIELRPPKGEEPINWVLFTTEPIDTREEILDVVDHYRARWRIEEFFKALKSGCSIERRQLTTSDGLLRALAFFIPVAWHLLALRTAAQQDAPIPATSMLTALQLVVLRALANDRGMTLADELTVREALLAIAALGGHLKRNGDPGWITLGRGYDKLLAAETVWRIATMKTAERSDQS
jgi:hypothetical protein